MKIKILLSLLLLCSCCYSQPLLQSMSGLVRDGLSGRGIDSAAVLVLDQHGQSVGSSYSRSDGSFEVGVLPLGRYDLIFFHPLYHSLRLREVGLRSGRPTYVEVELEMQGLTLGVVSITDSAASPVLEAMNRHRLSPARVQGWAGNLRDVSRMLMRFPGLNQTDDFQNSLAVRGNSPAGTQWYIEGLPLVNPNHLAFLGNSGGGYSLLNPRMVRHIDFYAGAFPANYGNALSAVLDVQLRKGNPARHQFQLGTSLLDVEASAEGPLGKRKKASYLLSARRANLDLAYKWFPRSRDYLGTLPGVQDVSYKLFFPLEKGWLSTFGLLGSSVLSLRQAARSEERTDYRSVTGLWGVSYMHFVGQRAMLKSSLAFAREKARNDFTGYNSFSELVHNFSSTSGQRYALDLSFSQQLFRRQQLRAGLLAQYRTDRLEADQRYRLSSSSAYHVFDRRQQYALFQGYLLWQAQFGQRLSGQVGVFGLYQGLNHTSSLAPRAYLAWQLSPRQSIRLAFGQHAMTQPTSIYLSGPKCLVNCYGEPTDELFLINLDLNKSRQFSLVYQLKSLKTFSLKAEAYWLTYYNIAQGFRYGELMRLISSLNFGVDGDIFYPTALLNNGGKGQSKGIELSLEGTWGPAIHTYFSASLYDARYTNSYQPPRNTAFNGRYTANLLLDKTFTLNTLRQHQLHIGLAMMAAGGRRYTPPRADKPWVPDDTRPFEAQYKDYFRTDLKIGLQQNFKRFSHTISLDIRNLFNTQNEYYREYSRHLQEFITHYQVGFLPLLFYEIEF